MNVNMCMCGKMRFDAHITFAIALLLNVLARFFSALRNAMEQI